MTTETQTVSLTPRASQIRQMFGDVAPTYDLLNHTLSLKTDVRWRRRAVRRSLRPDDRRVLDLCCGTGDFSLAYRAKLHPEGQVIGSDFARPMLTKFQSKQAKSEAVIPLIEADSLQVPFPDATFDIASVAFGLRNIDGTQAGLAEMRRVVRPGGRVVVLEFCPPRRPNLFNRMFGFYFRHILPRIGRVVSRHPTAYSYLPQSVEGFPPREEIVEMMRSVGLAVERVENLSGGIATLFVAERTDA